MERWIAERAGELGLTLGQGAARLLAERVGAFVREETSIARQTELADGELEKLALLRPDGVATREDVAESVPEAIRLDVGVPRRRRPATSADAARIAERLSRRGRRCPCSWPRSIVGCGSWSSCATTWRPERVPRTWCAS
jgi:hypothetical protein